MHSHKRTHSIAIEIWIFVFSLMIIAPPALVQRSPAIKRLCCSLSGRLESFTLAHRFRARALNLDACHCVKNNSATWEQPKSNEIVLLTHVDCASKGQHSSRGGGFDDGEADREAMTREGRQQACGKSDYDDTQAVLSACLQPVPVQRHLTDSREQKACSCSLQQQI